MNFSDVKALVSEHIERVCHLMEETLSSDIDLLNRTNASILEGGGKRLRPMLALLCGWACGRVHSDTERFAAAAELLHNATLLHDDVVDGATTRRGRPTVMSVLNAPASVLIGDYWLTKAMELILSAGSHAFEVISIFAKTLSDLAEGEMLQMEKSDACDTVFADYERIIYCKTASLFEASAYAAALSAEAPAPWQDAVRRYAVDLGIAFQIRDDILDYSGGEIGKPVGQDLMERKITLPLLSALETVSPDEEAAVRRRLRDIPDDPAAREEIAAFVKEHQGIPRAQRVLESYIDRACQALEVLPGSAQRDALAEMARFIGIRNV